MELFKGDVSGGEAGTGFPRMVLLFLSGTMITSNGHILDRHFRKFVKRVASLGIRQIQTLSGNGEDISKIY